MKDMTVSRETIHRFEFHGRQRTVITVWRLLVEQRNGSSPIQAGSSSLMRMANHAHLNKDDFAISKKRFDDLRIWEPGDDPHFFIGLHENDPDQRLFEISDEEINELIRYLESLGGTVTPIKPCARYTRSYMIDMSNEKLGELGLYPSFAGERDTPKTRAVTQSDH